MEKFRSAAFSGSGSSGSKSTSASQSNRPSAFGDTSQLSSHDLTSSSSSPSSSLYIRSVNSSEVIEGGDAVLRCEFERHNSLFAVAAWFRDDGRIFLPVEQLVDAVRRSVGGSGGRSGSGSGGGGGGTGGGHESSFGKLVLTYFPWFPWFPWFQSKTRKCFNYAAQTVCAVVVVDMF